VEINRFLDFATHHKEVLDCLALHERGLKVCKRPVLYSCMFKTFDSDSCTSLSKTPMTEDVITATPICLPVHHTHIYMFTDKKVYRIPETVFTAQEDGSFQVKQQGNSIVQYCVQHNLDIRDLDQVIVLQHGVRVWSARVYRGGVNLELVEFFIRSKSFTQKGN